MKSTTVRSRMLAIAVVAVITAWLVGAAVLADDGQRCRLAGSWLTTNPDTGGVFLDTLSPMDPAEKKLAYASEWINQDPTFGGFFPTATYVSIIRGEMVRTGRDSGHVSILGYGLTAPIPGMPREILYAAVISGPFEVVDCDTLVYLDGTLSIYAPWQDPLGDEPPAFGCVPYTPLEARRVTVAPQCEVPPEP